MRERTRLAVACAMALSLSIAPAHAADAGPDASAEGAASGEGGAPRPETGSPHGGDPHGARHGQGGGGDASGIFEPPPDVVEPDPRLPSGAISIRVLDADEKPVPGAGITLGVLYNSVAKGESRKRLGAEADGEGRARFSGLETGTGVAYRVSVTQGDASFAVPPFQLQPTAGMNVVLHVYPSVSDPTGTLIVSQLMVYVEVKDDRVQVQQAVRVFNAGRAAWVPKDFVLPLPEDFTAFATQQQMSDISAEAVPKRGVKLRGTFTPGQHLVEFRWQVPYSGEATVKLALGAPPRLFGARIIAPASKDMTLDVPGFPAPQPTTGMGQRVLLTEKRYSPQEPSPGQVALEIRGLPTAGPARVIATALAALGLVLGVVLGADKRQRRGDVKGLRRALLDEIEALERARQSGDIGPKTYERLYRDLTARLARTYAKAPAA